VGDGERNQTFHRLVCGRSDFFCALCLYATHVMYRYYYIFMSPFCFPGPNSRKIELSRSKHANQGLLEQTDLKLAEPDCDPSA
jgi:hypothetical protein